ncbi:MAG TPA: vanadium-dependent haloperoxidase [Chitinophagaceae bacterium]|nr:vanadium-dependent haloperoxidase [Chitinophagaceae bacterium]
MNLWIKHPFRLQLFVVLVLLVVPYGCKKTDLAIEPSTSDAKAQRTLKQSEENADVVYQWYHFMEALQRPVNPQPNPIVAMRRFAYIGIGLFESVQPGIKGGSSFGPKLIDMPVMPKPDHSKDYLWAASANAALSSLFKMFAPGLSKADSAKIDANELATYNQLKATTSEDVLKRSEAFGRSIAAAIWAWSATDGFSVASTSYTPVNAPWAWVPTPPAAPNSLPFAADLRYSRPLLKYSLTALAPPLPVPYSEDPNSAFFAEAKEVRDLGGTLTATAANKATANWWADAGGVGVGVPAPYHLLAIITSVLESQHAGLWKAAEVYAKTGIAMKDGGIITFRSKYHYNLLRPITYIRRHMDATWVSHLGNPAYSDYTSGLVGFFGPVMQVLINEFGDIPAMDNSYNWRGDQPRQYNSISQMRLEAALSRVYAGIHYRFTQMASIDMAIELANEIDKVRVVGPEYK